MAGRKDKNTVNYFPHYCMGGKTIFILENKYGNDGYSVWFKVLELLGSTENHFIDCRELSSWEYLQAKMRLDSDKLNEILNCLSNLDAIHKELWENKIIWSVNFIRNINDVYLRRKSQCMDYNDLCSHLLIKCKHKYTSEGIITDNNTQSKVKKSKVKESIKKKLVFYSNEIKNIEENESLKERYISLVGYLFGENAIGCPVEHILKLEKQLTYDEYKKLFSASNSKNLTVGELFDSWVNSPKYSKNKVSIYLTLNNWINRSDGKNIKQSPEKKLTEVVKTGETLSLLEIINKMSKKKGQKDENGKQI